MSKESSTTAWRRRRYGDLQQKLESSLIEHELDDLNMALSSLALQGDQTGSLGDQPAPSASAESRESLCANLPTSSNSPGPTDAKPRDRVTDIDDLAYIQLGLARNMMIFTLSGTSLHFIRHPLDSSPEASSSSPSPAYNLANAPPLDREEPSNAIFLDYSDWLSSSLATLSSMGALGDPNVDVARTHLMAQVADELQRLADLREMEWERQQAAAARDSEGTTQHDHVNTARHFARLASEWQPVEAPVYAAAVIGATFNLLFKLPLRATRVLLAGMRSAIRLTLQYARSADPIGSKHFVSGISSGVSDTPTLGSEDNSLTTEDRRLLRFLSRDPRTILSAFDLDPCVTPYICCPACFALYKDFASTPVICSYRSTSTSEPCEAKLWRTRTIRGKTMRFPVRKYLHQSMKHWLGRMLSRHEIETWLQLRRFRGTSEPIMKDMFDALALQHFLDHDGTSFFLDGPDDELRLIFSLSADGFNPFQMKEAKQTVSSTAIYMVCMNLPPHLRHLVENMYLVGVIPGPTKPSTEQINHFISIVVDKLLEFWQPGVYYRCTALRPHGRRARAALVPVICDILGARQVAGLGAHNHTYLLCHVCGIKSDEVECTDRFPPRDLAAHKLAAASWRDASSTLEREQLFKQNGIRWSELLRLPYWNPFLYLVIDTMHNLYLGLLQRHIRDFWGISVDADDGDASADISQRGPPRPLEAKMEDGVDALLYGSHTRLKACGKAVLYHLCLDCGLRHAGTVSLLMRSLEDWRTREQLPRDRATNAVIKEKREELRPLPENEEMPDYGDLLTPEIAQAEKTLSDAVKFQTVARKKKAVLQSMCAARHISYVEKDIRDTLAKWLLDWRDARRSQKNLPSSQAGVRSGFPGPTSAATSGLPGPSSTPPDATPAICTPATPSTDAATPERTTPSTAARNQNVSPGFTEPVVSSAAPIIHAIKVVDDALASATRNVEEEPSSAPSQFHAIGRSTLREYVNDRTRMEFPSWLNPPPISFGTTQHGKLSADQWRTVGTINLPITLIRTWGLEGGRRAEMVKNFLEVVEAIETIGLLEIDENSIQRAEYLMKSYLDTAKDLYKWAKIQPNHHLALHLGLFLRLFGPVHSWRSFVFERFNYFLQSLNTNMNFGELEATFMIQTCRAANFRPLLRMPPVRNAMPEFIQVLEDVRREDHRGMRLDSLLRLDDVPLSQPLAGKKTRRLVLDSATMVALVKRLNALGGQDYFDESQAPPSQSASAIPISPSAAPCSQIAISGVFYKNRTRAQGDSNIIFCHPDIRHPRPGRIEQIFLHSRPSSEEPSVVTETFLVVQRLQSLSKKQGRMDPYRQYPSVGGRLYYDTYLPDVYVIRPEDVVCHFVKTSMPRFPSRQASETEIYDVGCQDSDGKAIDSEELSDEDNDETGKPPPAKTQRTYVHVRPLDRLLHLRKTVDGEEVDSLEAAAGDETADEE